MTFSREMCFHGRDMSLLRGLLRNTVSLTTGRICAKILGAVFIAFLARAVGPAGVGKYVYVASLIAMFMLLPNFGFDTLLVREVAKRREEGKEIIDNILTIKLVLALFASFLLISFVGLRHYDNQTTQIIRLMLISGLLSLIFEIFYSVFRAFERMQFEAALLVCKNLLMVVLGVLAIKLGLQLTGIVLAVVLGDVLCFLLGMYVIRHYFVRISPKMNLNMIRKIITAAIPFGLLAIIEIVFINTDYLMIAKLEGETAVGWYSAAVKLLVMVLLVPHMFMNAIFPVLSRLYASATDSLARIYSKAFSYMLMMAFPVAAGGFLLSDQIILLIYGAEFHNSILVLKVMIWVVLFSFVGFVNGATLNATGRERLFALMQGFSALSNIFLDYILIKRFGYIGACYATLILTGLGFIVYSTICHRQLAIKPDFSIIAKSLTASIIMGVVVFFLRKVSLNLVLLIPTGILSYFALILLLGTIPKEDSWALRNVAYRSSA